MKQAGLGFIALHLGAGYHSIPNEKNYRMLCKTACLKGMEAVRAGHPALQVVSIILSLLEDSPWTNAGIGSNLTDSGDVECDASIMDGLSHGFGAVGVLTEFCEFYFGVTVIDKWHQDLPGSGIRNPIQAAARLLEEEVQGITPRGLVPPVFLVGEGARQWARERGLQEATKEAMITEKSLAAFEKFKSTIEGTRTGKKRKLEDLCNIPSESTSLDTVGALCLDARGHLCAGVSSGGIALKSSGRVGQAAVYGAGCWATDENRTGVACCTSGCGEHLIKTSFAKQSAEMAFTRDAVEAAHESLRRHFLDSKFLASAQTKKLGGLMLVKVQESQPESRTVHLVWGHTTDSMCVAFMGAEHNTPEVRISRLPGGSSQESIALEGTVYRQRPRLAIS